jgi:hypothetical protein
MDLQNSFETLPEEPNTRAAASAPIKRKLIVWPYMLGIGVMLLLVGGLIAAGLVVFFSNRSNGGSLESTNAIAQPTEKLTDTPCYSLDAAGLNTTSRECDMATLVDNGGYFPGIDILTYQENSYGSFDAFKAQYEKDLRSDTGLTNITAQTVTIDGVDGVRYEYQRVPKANVDEVFIGSEEGWRPTYYEVWVDIDGKLAYTLEGGGDIKSFSIKGSDETEMVKQTFDNSLSSLKWKLKN